MIEVTDQLQWITGEEQRVTSAYHPLTSSSVERQNYTIKNALVNV